MLGRTDLEIEISNQCGLLIASAIIYYNASIHSHLLNKNPGNKKVLKFLKKSSPAAWQHIHFTGYFSFYNNRRKIDIDKMLEDISFNWTLTYALVKYFVGNLEGLCLEGL